MSVRVLLIENGQVVNASKFDTVPQGWIEDQWGAGPGWPFENGAAVPPPATPPSEEEQAKIDAQNAKAARQVLALQGFEFQGVTVSATKDDMNGLNTILTNLAFLPNQETVFEFENGARLLVNQTVLNELLGPFIAFRHGLFNT
jgi:hypothetical protein